MQYSLSLSQLFKMLKTPDMLLLFCLVGAASALYKQWIPDTNYENETNWGKEDVPCGNDIVQFLAQRKVSVFMNTAHAVHELRMPLGGEFILNSGAGFYVVSGQDPDCGTGVTTEFKDSESLQWFDPTLWQTAATPNDLKQGNFLFSVHEESVPCHYDDVVFKAISSFRVDTSSSYPIAAVKSVSVLGYTFTNQFEFSQYLNSSSGKLQFHGSSSVTVGNSGCEDPSGCDCGNSVHHQQICSTITCDSPSCKKPLRPIGHCCDVCGAIVTIHFDEGFILQTYRERIRHLFLALPQYKGIQLGMSKVLKSQRLMGIISLGTSSEIQVVMLDGENGTQSAALAQDIVKDARTHGSYLGITGAEIQSASEEQSGGSAGLVAGVVLGVFLLLALIIILAVLIRKGVVQMPTLSRFRNNSDMPDLGGPLDHGFDNPMFDKHSVMPDIPSLYGTNSISMTQTAMHFVNPVYDENETDFNA